MSDPSYSVKQLVQALQAARVGQGLSQRALAAKAGITQPRLAKIEQGQVDLRVDTLMQLVRSLELELVLAPRRTLPAVQALVGSLAPHGGASVHDSDLRRLRKMLDALKTLQGRGVTDENAESAMRLTSSLIVRLQNGAELALAEKHLLERARKLCAALSSRAATRAPESLSRSTSKLVQELTRLNESVERDLAQGPEPSKGAFSMEED